VPPVQAPADQTTELRDGRTVRIRPIAPDDRDRLSAAFHRMSDESRQHRFLTAATELSSEDLQYLTDVDHRRHEALVAVDPDGDLLVGTARYVQVVGEREVAEVAVAVDDDWQRQGVATALLAALSALARENGVERFRAYVASDNAVVLDALERHGAARKPGEEPSEIEFEVEVPREELGERLGTALRAAAAGQLRMVERVARRLGVWRA
jgi:RimJ/RimL family protein N-acetyltransferase